MKPKQLKLLRLRDNHCWHCGAENDLVPHHRMNRGMGGRPSLDVLENIIMVCSQYNGEMESVAYVATQAKKWGHKLSSYEKFSKPVFDRADGLWFDLELDGTKKETTNATDEGQPLF